MFKNVPLREGMLVPPLNRSERKNYKIPGSIRGGQVTASSNNSRGRARVVILVGVVRQPNLMGAV